MLDGVSVIAAIAIASFAIDRIVSGLMFLLTFIGVISDPETTNHEVLRVKAERKHKLLYFLFAAILSTGVLAYYGNVTIFSAIGFEMPHLADVIVTGLLLVGGADQMAGLLKMTGTPSTEKAQRGEPVQIVGRLLLEERRPRHGVEAGAGGDRALSTERPVRT